MLRHTGNTLLVLFMILMALGLTTSPALATPVTQTGTCNISTTSDVCQSGSTDLTASISAIITSPSTTSQQPFTLTFSLTNNNHTTSATLVAFTLQLFDSAFSITTSSGSPTALTSWDVVAGGKQNNSGAPSTCHTANGTVGWLCVTSTATSGAGGPITIAKNSTETFSFTGSLDAGNTFVSPFDLMINGIAPNGTKYAISSSVTTPGGPPPHELPEPASLLMMGTGLLTLGALVRRRVSR